VWPFPWDRTIAAEHRASVGEYFASSTHIVALGVADLAPSIAFGVCQGLGVFAFALAGGFAALRQVREPSPRILGLVLLSGVGAFCVYPYRLDRFLLPTAFPWYAFAGAALTIAPDGLRRHLSSYAPRAGGAAAVLVLAVVCIPWTEAPARNALDAFNAIYPPAFKEKLAARWRDPFLWFEPGVRAHEDPRWIAMDAAAARLDTTRPSAWIGDPFGVHAGLLRWRAYQRTRAKRVLVVKVGGETEMLHSTAWNPNYAEWISTFPQVAVLEKSAGSRRDDIEAGARAWLDRQSAYAVRERLWIGTGNERRQLSLYTRSW
jgi:hypothetical protein